MIKLRNMTEEDIEDYVRWFTTETEWMKTDAPWEFEEIVAASADATAAKAAKASEEASDETAGAIAGESAESPAAAAERASWTEYYEQVRSLPEDAFRWKFEIEVNGRHVGWVSSYDDLEYVDNPDEIPAIGIDIPDTTVWNKGVATEALRQFIDYFRAHGYRRLYTQTWSGNYAMLRVAAKLGFTEHYRKKNHRTVRGRQYDAVTLVVEV